MSRVSSRDSPDTAQVLSAIQNSLRLGDTPPESDKRPMFSPSKKRSARPQPANDMICSSPQKARLNRKLLPDNKEVKARHTLLTFFDKDTNEEKEEQSTEELFSPQYTAKGDPSHAKKKDSPKNYRRRPLPGQQRLSDYFRRQSQVERELRRLIDRLPQFSYEFLCPSHYESFEDEQFDPLLFIKQLPELPLSELCRPYSLPKKTRQTPQMTLVLDLDETLVHCSTQYMEGSDLSFTVVAGGTTYVVYVKKRPYFDYFLENVSRKFEVVVFTASQQVYAEKLLNLLDPERKHVRHRLFREACVVVDGNYLKDLRVLGRDLSKTMVVDNSPQAFGYQTDNGVPIESWFDDDDDVELLKLLKLLENMHDLHLSDIRPFLRSKFQLRSMLEKYYSYE